MKMTLAQTVAVLSTVVVCVGAAGADRGGAGVRQDDNGHGQLWRIMRRASGTPEGRGLLPTAITEAQVATQQVALVVGAATLERVKLHAAYLIHALDPSRIPTGPGFGYGVRRALSEIAAAARFAGAAPQASSNLRVQAGPVATAAERMVACAEDMVRAAETLQAVESSAEWEPLANRLATLRAQLFAGADRNGDGRIAWDEGEGGLTALQEQLSLILAGEGIR